MQDLKCFDFYQFRSDGYTGLIWGMFSTEKRRSGIREEPFDRLRVDILRRMSRDQSPREHEKYSYVIVSLSIVFCSTGTILRRKGNGRRQVRGEKLKVQSSKPRKVEVRDSGPGFQRRSVHGIYFPSVWSRCFVSNPYRSVAIIPGRSKFNHAFGPITTALNLSFSSASGFSQLRWP
jgi:hypothetical protein